MADTSESRLLAGKPVWLEPGLRRVLAPNPSPLTGPGTNSYILGEGRVALIDPGPDSEAHLEALLAALAPGEQVEMIVVTHAHHDHSELAARLAARVGAPVVAFGDARAGLNPAFAALGDLGGGEGADHHFRPDETVAHGEMLHGTGWSLGVIHTPGHFGNHICLSWGEAMFSGDQAMGWSTSIVSPPDGDMTAYMDSLDRLMAAAPRRLYPGHGAEVADGPARLEELVRHRRGRESQILAALGQGGGTASELAARIYTDVPAGLLPAATRNVFAHLLDLEARSQARSTESARLGARWEAI
ncbi:MBL fold metallo-hydrolase [Gemmobacter sp.]|uniref:MBL fold metallo-hydrolase n=1 Tax=Gemmobacter sp. TaxID=1898957 RepID=UPI002AFFC801|nr:MBL fold metallo-hydrolase [Gemmobacter sp.]